LRSIIFRIVATLACLVATNAVAYDWDGQYDDNCCCDEGRFNGFYVGANVGVASNTAHLNDLDGFFSAPGPAGWTSVKTGVIGGIQLGYDWQCSSRVLGLVVDWNGADTHHHVRVLPNTATVNQNGRHDFKWFTTIRARFGLAVCDSLVYLTVGGVVARHRHEFQNGLFQSQHHQSRWGWTAGVGTEFAVACNWSAGFEVLTFQFSDRRRSFTPVGTTTPVAFGTSASTYLARFTVNYRFSLF
jgi:outer membrane immunogenic protein